MVFKIYCWRRIVSKQMLDCPIESFLYLVTLDIQKFKRMETNRRTWEYRASGQQLRAKFTCISTSLTSRITLVSTKMYRVAQKLLTNTALSVAPRIE